VHQVQVQLQLFCVALLPLAYLGQLEILEPVQQLFCA
jgi:hypothetical protein